MKNNFWNELKKPIICLAPMAGITDQPFRIMCKKFGADVVYSEMVSSDAIWHKKIPNPKSQTCLAGRRVPNKFQSQITKIPNVLDIGKFKFEDYLGFSASNLEFSLLKTLNLIRFSEIEKPYIVQIFGSDPEKMAYSAEYISSGKWYKDYEFLTQNLEPKTQNYNLKIENCKLKTESIPDGIDINMGCPAKDVIKIGAGSALMKDPKRASEITKAIKKKTKLPVSIKTRLGWDNPQDCLVFCRTLEYAGADAIAIHARTYKQGFSGKPDWEMVYQVKKQLKIPVILNGGIETLEDFQKVDLNKVDGVMIGRGAWGRPLIFDRIKNPNFQFSIFNFQLMKDIILGHACLVDRLKGKQGIIEFRKHLAWYFKGIPDSKKIKEKLVKVNSLDEIKKILSIYT